MHSDDSLVLEDESGRVKLGGTMLLPSVYVTGQCHKLLIKSKMGIGLMRLLWYLSYFFGMKGTRLIDHWMLTHFLLVF